MSSGHSAVHAIQDTVHALGTESGLTSPIHQGLLLLLGSCAGQAAGPLPFSASQLVISSFEPIPTLPSICPLHPQASSAFSWNIHHRHACPQWSGTDLPASFWAPYRSGTPWRTPQQPACINNPTPSSHSPSSLKNTPTTVSPAHKSLFQDGHLIFKTKQPVQLHHPLQDKTPTPLTPTLLFSKCSMP